MTPVAAFFCATVPEKPLDRDFLRTLLFQARFGQDGKEPEQKTNKNQSRDKQKKALASAADPPAKISSETSSLATPASAAPLQVLEEAAHRLFTHTGQ